MNSGEEMQPQIAGDITKEASAKGNLLPVEFALEDPRQTQFVYWIVMGMRQTEAARRANYPETSAKVRASELMKMPHILKAIAEMRQALASQLKIDHSIITQGILEAIQDAKIISDPRTQIMGWTELAKLFGLYAPEIRKIELTVSQKRKQNELDMASDEELLRIAGNDDAIEAEFYDISDRVQTMQYGEAEDGVCSVQPEEGAPRLHNLSTGNGEHKSVKADAPTKTSEEGSEDSTEDEEVTAEGEEKQ